MVEYAGVADPGLARRTGLFVAEGRIVVHRLIRDGRYRVRSVLVSDAARHQLADVLALLDADVPVFVCPIEAFQTITGFNIHRGCVALVERPPRRDIRELLEGARLVLALESIANPDNVGGVFRNAAAFGVDGVLVDAATGDPFYRKAIRTSMGAVLRVPFACVDWPEALPVLRQGGFRIVALTPQQPAEPLDRFARNHDGRPLALLVGNEGAGLSAASAASADVRVRIPMNSDMDSLNVAVAAGIALSQLTRFPDVW